MTWSGLITLRCTLITNWTCALCSWCLGLCDLVQGESMLNWAFHYHFGRPHSTVSACDTFAFPARFTSGQFTDELNREGLRAVYYRGHSLFGCPLNLHDTSFPCLSNHFFNCRRSPLLSRSIRLLRWSTLQSIRLSTAWQYDPPPELLQRDRLPQNEVGLLLS